MNYERLEVSYKQLFIIAPCGFLDFIKSPSAPPVKFAVHWQWSSMQEKMAIKDLYFCMPGVSNPQVDLALEKSSKETVANASEACTVRQSCSVSMFV